MSMKRTHRHPPHRHGWTLIEIVVVISLLAVFLLIESKVFLGVVQLWRGVRETETQIAQFDAAIRMLRRDVWAASSIDAAETGDTLRIARPDGVISHWSAGQTLTRETGGVQTRWPDPGQTLRFATQGPVVVVTTRSPLGAEAQLLLVSQVQLAEVKP